MDRRSILVGFLAGGWVVTLLGWGPFSPFKPATAADAPNPPVGQPGARPDPYTPNPPGRTINPAEGTRDRGTPNPGGGTAAMNNRAIALAGSVGSGESVVYYFDTEAERLLVYQYRPGERGGVRLMAARHIDFDLRLEEYRDLSEKSRDDLKADYEKMFKAVPVGPLPGGGGEMPVKKVDLGPGK